MSGLPDTITYIEEGYGSEELAITIEPTIGGFALETRYKADGQERRNYLSVGELVALRNLCNTALRQGLGL